MHRALPSFLPAAAGAHAPGGETPAPAAGPFDVVIEGGRVVDGTGNPWFYGDVAITGDRIARITPAGLLPPGGVHSPPHPGGLVAATGSLYRPAPLPTPPPPADHH